MTHISTWTCMIRQTFYGFTVFWYTPRTFSRCAAVAETTWRAQRWKTLDKNGIESNKKPNWTEEEGISGRVRMRLTTECNVGSVGLGDPAAWRAGGNAAAYRWHKLRDTQWQPQRGKVRGDAARCEATRHGATTNVQQNKKLLTIRRIGTCKVRDMYAQWNR